MPGIKTRDFGAAFTKFKEMNAGTQTHAERYENVLSSYYQDPNNFTQVHHVSDLAKYQIIFTDGSISEKVMTMQQRACMNRLFIWSFVSSVKGMGYQQPKATK